MKYSNETAFRAGITELANSVANVDKLGAELLAAALYHCWTDGQGNANWLTALFQKFEPANRKDKSQRQFTALFDSLKAATRVLTSRAALGDDKNATGSVVRLIDDGGVLKCVVKGWKSFENPVEYVDGVPVSIATGVEIERLSQFNVPEKDDKAGKPVDNLSRLASTIKAQKSSDTGVMYPGMIADLERVYSHWEKIANRAESQAMIARSEAQKTASGLTAIIVEHADEMPTQSRVA